MAKRFLTPLNLSNLASDPATGSEGDLYFNTTNDVVKIYVNGEWTELQGGGGGSVIYSPEQPDINTLDVGTIWMDSNAEIADIGTVVNLDSYLTITNASNTYATKTELNNINLSSAINTASAAAFASASTYTDIQISNIDLEEYLTTTSASNTYATKIELENLAVGEINLNSTIATASAAAFASASAYTDQQIDTINLGEYLTIISASSTYATKAELEEVAAGEIDLNATITTASAAAFASASAYTDQQISTIDLSLTIQTASAAAVSYLVDGAPAALDTLNELAAALDDNADILDLYLTQSSASSTYATKITRWRKTYSFSGNESFTVTNSGAGAYVVSGVQNPTFNLVKGNTYTFVINASGHPFWIQTVSGGYSSGNIYSTGTTNLGTDNGTITWTVPTNAPDTLYYACQFHSSMQGTINLIDPAKIQGVDDNSNTLSYNPGYELLYINGILLATNEYTTTSSSLITLNEGLSTNDVVDIVIGG
jgi:plastocyanin